MPSTRWATTGINPRRPRRSECGVWWMPGGGCARFRAAYTTQPRWRRTPRWDPEPGSSGRGVTPTAASSGTGWRLGNTPCIHRNVSTGLSKTPTSRPSRADSGTRCRYSPIIPSGSAAPSGGSPRRTPRSSPRAWTYRAAGESRRSRAASGTRRPSDVAAAPSTRGVAAAEALSVTRAVGTNTRPARWAARWRVAGRFTRCRAGRRARRRSCRPGP